MAENADEANLDAGAAPRNPATLVDARDGVQALVETIWRLRQPDGCPWDKKQTHASIAKNMIEEAYEAVDAIEADDPAHLREELGDVLMQVVLQAQIAADAGEFTLADVADDINAKLIRRHPHVFGSDGSAPHAETAEDVQAIWSRVKLAEKEAADKRADAAGERPAGLLDAVPRGLPALMQAQKVSKKAAAAGFEWESVADIWDKVDEERAEFLREPTGTEAAEMEFGDILFALVNVARREGVDAESALRASTAKFRARWAAMEDAARAEGRAIEDLDMAELNDLWERAKAGE